VDNAAGFYNSLFAVEFTVLGILIAAIFLFLQIIYQDRLYKFLDRTARVRLFSVGALSLLSLSLTATGALFASFPNHHFIPFYKFNSGNYVLNPWFALVALTLCLISTIVTIWVAIAELLSLQPSRLIERAAKNIDGSEIRRFLIKEYGITEPFDIQVVVGSLLDEEDKDPVSDQDSNATNDGEKALYDRLIADTQAAHDPLEFIGQIAIRAIRQRDGVAFENALDAFGGVFEKEEDVFVEPPPQGKWDPNDELAEHLLTYLLRYVSTFINECKKENESEFSQRAYELTNKLASRSLDRKNQPETARVISFWKFEADRTLNEIAIYAYLVRSLKGLAERVFSKQNEGFEKQIADEVFRSLGWLIGRLMAKQGIETKPLMLDTEYETPYEIVFNSLMSFSWAYNRDGARFYPLMFFDAVSVLFDALLEEVGEDENKAKRRLICESLLDCALAYSQFAESAIMVGNGKGASLATMQLQRIYNDLAGKADIAEMEELRRDVIGFMIRLALVATGRDPRSITAEFMAGGIDDYLFKTLSKIPDSYSSTFDKEVPDAIFEVEKHHSHDAVVAFLKRLGEARNSTFGLNL
jgi:hypothetical protein